MVPGVRQDYMTDKQYAQLGCTLTGLVGGLFIIVGYGTFVASSGTILVALAIGGLILLEF